MQSEKQDLAGTAVITSGAPTPGWGEVLHRSILYCDSNVLILNKPAGLAVHPGSTTTDSVEQYLEEFRFGVSRAPALAHRLDRDTSGCLVLGRQDKALRRLGRMFAGGLIEKVYWAVVIGRPPADVGRVEAALIKRLEPAGWRMVVDPAGQAAVTDYRLLAHLAGPGGGLSWLELRPRTGRTHQIRVHCATILGTPVVGDPAYGPPPDCNLSRPDNCHLNSYRLDNGGPPSLHLHARSVTIPPLATTRTEISVTAPVPPHFCATLTRLGGDWDRDRDWDREIDSTG